MKNVLNSIIDEKNMKENERERIRKLVFQIINEEKKYEFNDDRSSVRSFIDKVLSGLEE